MLRHDSVLVRHADWWAVGVAVLTVLGFALTVWLAVNGGEAPGVAEFPWLTVLFTIGAFGMTGAVLIDRRPDLPFGWLLAAVAASQVVLVALLFPSATALNEGNDSSLVRWGLATAGLGFVPVAVQGMVNVRFPSGVPATRKARVLELALIVGTVAVVASLLFGATNLREVVPDGSVDLEHPLTGGTAIGAFFDRLILLAPIVVLLGLIAGIGVILRFRQADGIERQQLKWRATGVAVSFALFPFAVAEITDVVDPLDNLVFALTIVIPVARYRLWSIDTILRRSAVYGVVTILLVLGYVALIAVAAMFMPERIGAGVAAAAVALGLAPLATRIRRWVNRLVYGNRSDPYRTIRDLDRQLAETATPGGVLPPMLETIATSLRLPYVAIERPDRSILHARGQSRSNLQRWPILYEGTVEGQLVAVPRRGEDEFDDRDSRILADLARHAGAHVHAEALTTDLIASRQQLVAAREEERRRLRRDLHDGLGPTLTAVGLNLDAARSQLHKDPGTAEQYLDDAKEATTEAISDIRRVVYGLRPPALDNHGLVDAIELHLERLRTSDKCAFDLSAEDVPVLPAAVEVAAYRTVVEAVTNAIRHGAASRCKIQLSDTAGDFVVEVDDDGSSNEPWVPGVGLLSLKERAEELGGECIAGPVNGQGARVRARFPIAEVLR